LSGPERILITVVQQADRIGGVLSALKVEEETLHGSGHSLTDRRPFNIRRFSRRRLRQDRFINQGFEISRLLD
jgi:hypothetical protein